MPAKRKAQNYIQWKWIIAVSLRTGQIIPLYKVNCCIPFSAFSLLYPILEPLEPNGQGNIQAFGTARIKLRFNPASAPLGVGWWERLVGLVKTLMMRFDGKSKLNREELETSFCDVEVVINSRTLTYVSEDRGELMPLTSAMFISDSVNVSVGDLDEVEREQLGKRFRYRQRLREDLKSRFRTEYLANLVQHKSKHGKAQVHVSEVVLLGSDNWRRQWPLARVVEKIPGRDGICRLVELKRGQRGNTSTNPETVPVRSGRSAESTLSDLKYRRR